MRSRQNLPGREKSLSVIKRRQKTRFESETHIAKLPKSET